ncbi:hypothetical protein OIU84_000473 [Salix udensis]|uniref:Uncharacterized protein n=1 Tax=Salix udensis TaxID=889485 RepID=A0AAD6L505_9ROSI|nr:hypothetical protein OIU84_000473 [Salix udensis]
MGNTNAQGLEPTSQGECRGQENSLTRKPSPLLHSTSSMGLNGSKCNYRHRPYTHPAGNPFLTKGLTLGGF